MIKFLKKVIIIGMVLTTTVILGAKVEASTQLSKPKSVVIEMKNKTDVKIKWKKVKNATKYQIYYTTGNKYKKLCTTKKNTYVQKKLASGKTYKYKVRAIKGKTKSFFSKIAKVKTIGTNVINISSSVKGAKITLTWNKVRNASGYFIFRSQYGEYTKIGETKDTVFKNNTGVDLDTEYSYRIIPFITNNGKKIQGSIATKMVITEKSDYFLDIISPYEKPYWYENHTDSSFQMGGVNYNHGFTCMGYGESHEGNQGNVTYFNLHGNYAKLSFDAGILDGGERNDANVYIYNDGVLQKTFEIKANGLPRHYEIDIKNCVQLKICVYSGRWVAMYDSTYGFGNMIISK